MAIRAAPEPRDSDSRYVLIPRHDTTNHNPVYNHAGIEAEPAGAVWHNDQIRIAGNERFGSWKS